MLAARSRSLVVGGADVAIPSQAGPFFPTLAASRTDQVSLECKNLRVLIMGGIARTERQR